MPKGWVEAGKLDVSMEGGKPARIEAVTSSGKVTATISLAGNEKDATLAAVSKAICSAGARLAVAKTEPGAGTTSLPMYRPASTDPAADLALLCTAPEGMPADADPSQIMRIAMQDYEYGLASSKWRAWRKSMTATLVDEKATAAQRVEVRKNHGDELAAAAKAGGIKTCWFADRLREVH